MMRQWNRLHFKKAVMALYVFAIVFGMRGYEPNAGRKPAVRDSKAVSFKV